MGKTRSCRRTDLQNEIHDQAVKIRKMTDDKLVEYIRSIVAQEHNHGYVEGLEAGKKDCADISYEIGAFIENVADLPGIGTATTSKMKQVARKRGYHVE